jgi:hypothetical protein
MDRKRIPERAINIFKILKARAHGTTQNNMIQSSNALENIKKRQKSWQ